MQNQFPEIYLQYLGVILVVILLLGFIITILLLYQKKKLLQEKELQTIKSNFEKELLQTNLEIQENVLKSVSLEIHDNIGQIMLLTKINLTMLQRMNLPPEAPELIQDTKLMLSKASEDISQLSRSLNSTRITELGVFNAIDIDLKALERRDIATITIANRGGISGQELPNDTQLLVFRMFQEICNNIIKHSECTKINVSIEQVAGGIEFKIIDNGVGFDFSSSDDSPNNLTGLGLRSLSERAKLFNGKIDINSVLKKGTSICIFIPLV